MTGEQLVIRTPEIHLRSPEFSYIKFFWSLQILAQYNRAFMYIAVQDHRQGRSLFSLYVRILHIRIIVYQDVNV